MPNSQIFYDFGHIEVVDWGIHTWGRGDDKFFNPRGKTNHHPREAKPRGDDGFFPPRVEKLIIPETPGVSAIHLILIA